MVWMEPPYDSPAGALGQLEERREFLTVQRPPHKRHRKRTQRPGWVPLAGGHLIPGALGATAEPGNPPAAPGFRPL